VSRPTHWWWIRHAPVPGGGTRIYGQRDVDCDLNDDAGLRALAALLPAGAVGVVSTLRRTRQTYDALVAAGAELPAPVVEPELAEQSFGRWEGLSWAEMEVLDTAAYRTFWECPTQLAPPGGESCTAMMARAAAAIITLTGRYGGRDIVCVSHGGTIRAAVATALGLSAETAMAIVVDNLSLTRLSHVTDGPLRGRAGAWMVRCINMPSRPKPAAAQ
jgi:alpha-ribazole phosphatase